MKSLFEKKYKLNGKKVSLVGAVITKFWKPALVISIVLAVVYVLNQPITTNNPAAQLNDVTILSAFIDSVKGNDVKDFEVIEVRVEAGDTLWDLSAKYAPNQHTAEMVSLNAKLNNNRRNFNAYETVKLYAEKGIAVE